MNRFHKLEVIIDHNCKMNFFYLNIKYHNQNDFEIQKIIHQGFYLKFSVDEIFHF